MQFQSRQMSGSKVQRILTWHHVSLAAVTRGPGAGKVLIKTRQLKRIHADHPLPGCFQSIDLRFPAICFADPGQPIVTLHFYDRAQCEWRV